MKRTLFSILFVLLCGLSCTKSCQKEKDDKVLRIGTNPNFPPFESIDDKGVMLGFDIDMGHALAKAMGKEAKFREFDFDALILALKNGQIDVILSGMSITASRQKEIAMLPYQGKPLTQISFMFWEQMPADIKDLESLKSASEAANLEISVQSGHFLENFLKESGFKVKALAGPPEQVIDIKYKKSLAAAFDISNAMALVSKDPLLKVITLDLPKENWDLGYGLGISKERTELIAKLRTALELLKKNGTILELEKKWHLSGEK
jgi:arginine transport system substrate-binding protein